MKKKYQIGQAAQLAGLSVETLRHYDRVDLVKPQGTDQESGYRYYSDFEVAQLQIVRFLRSIDLSLQEIKRMLYDDDISSSLNTLHFAEQKIDEEINRLLQVKYHLQSTRQNYSTKKNVSSARRVIHAPIMRRLPAQTIFLAQGLKEPTLDNLFRLHDTVEAQIAPEIREHFQFENAAGVLLKGGQSHLFATCLQSHPHPNLEKLPEGQYLCSSCGAQEYTQTIGQLRQFAKDNFSIQGDMVVLDLVFTGIIQWEYEVNLYLGNHAGDFDS